MKGPVGELVRLRARMDGLASTKQELESLLWRLSQIEQTARSDLAKIDGTLSELTRQHDLIARANVQR